MEQPTKKQVNVVTLFDFYFLLISFIWTFFFITFSSYLTASASTWTDDFSSTQNIESYNLSFNLALGQFRPLQGLEEWNSGSGAASFSSLDFGDGSQGAFNSSTFSQFGTVSGNTITINTNQYYPLKVTSFHLPVGWTLRGTGSNPIDIRSLSDIVIEGTIDCNGDNGEDIQSNNALISQGGTGHCGGGNGGSGGSITDSAVNGFSGGSPVSGGLGANSTNGAGTPPFDNAGATGGGGGGSFRQTGTPAEDGYDSNEVTWVSAGTNSPDDAFTLTGGGSGGGGGAAYGGTDTTNHSNGGGGGGGGGSVLLRAVRDIEVRGTVRANGGSGGGTSGTLRGGGGGGGGGGSVAVWAGRDLIFTGAITATSGSGGHSGIDVADAPTGDHPNQGKGGDGSDGRTWITDKDKCSIGICTSNESPSTLLLDEGKILSERATYTLTSRIIDLGNTQPTFLSATIDGHLGGSGSSTQIEISSSALPDASGFSSWSQASSLAGQKLERYLRFRLTLNNQDAVNPTTIDSFSINYDEHIQNKFQLVSSCGQIKPESPTTTPSLFLFGIFLGIPLLLRWFLYSQINTKH